jgi:hypothetical protein
MAITDEMNKGAAVAAPETAGKSVDADVVAKHKAFRNLGESIRSNMTEEEKAAEGSKSGTLEFVHCLGNPKVPQPRKENGQTIPSVQVVGYTFKTTEDIDVPVMPYVEGASSNLLNVEYGAETRHIAAGTTFNLNVLEAGGLLSKVEYAGKASGGGRPVVLAVSFSKTRPDPLPQLRLESQSGSIKDTIIDVATKGADGKWACKPEYQEFGKLFVSRTSTRPGSGAPKAAGESSKSVAAAFRDFLAKKNA